MSNIKGQNNIAYCYIYYNANVILQPADQQIAGLYLLFYIRLTTFLGAKT